MDQNKIQDGGGKNEKYIGDCVWVCVFVLLKLKKTNRKIIEIAHVISWPHYLKNCMLSLF